PFAKLADEPKWKPSAQTRPFLVNDPADRHAPRRRSLSLRENIRSTNPFIWRANASPYPYHHTRFTLGSRSESTYLLRTISSKPKLPWVRPRPLALTPPCGASLMPKQLTTSFTITVPASIFAASASPRARSRVQTLAASPYSESLAKAIASSSLSNGMTG